MRFWKFTMRESKTRIDVASAKRQETRLTAVKTVLENSCNLWLSGVIIIIKVVSPLKVANVSKITFFSMTNCWKCTKFLWLVQVIKTERKKFQKCIPLFVEKMIGAKQKASVAARVITSPWISFSQVKATTNPWFCLGTETLQFSSSGRNQGYTQRLWIVKRWSMGLRVILRQVYKNDWNLKFCHLLLGNST